jgi:hypothetical protein
MDTCDLPFKKKKKKQQEEWKQKGYTRTLCKMSNFTMNEPSYYFFYKCMFSIVVIYYYNFKKN